MRTIVRILKPTIAAKLILALLGSGVFLIVVTTAIQFYYDYNREMHLLDVRMHEVEQSSVPAMVNSIWIADWDMMRVQAESIQRLPEIRRVEVVVDGREIAAFGEKLPDAASRHTFPLAQWYKKRAVPLGFLILYTDKNTIRQRLLGSVAMALGIQIVTILIISSVLFFLFHRLAGRHLIALANQLRILGQEQMETPLVLDKKPAGRSGMDEIDQVVISFNEMRHRLRRSFDELRQTNGKLLRENRERIKADTALRESEEKFRTVADYTYGWEIWEDSTGSCRYCSPSCERVTGYSPEAFRADSGLLERLIHPEDLQRWKAHHAYIHSDAGKHESVTGPANEFEFRLLRRDGEVRWINHICYHVYDPEGHDLGHRISNRDTTEHKRLEAEIVKSRNLEALGILAGGIAHDFNNLLQGLLGNLELAKMNTEKSSEAFPFLENAGQLYASATKLTGQLIAFSPGGNLLPINIQPASYLKEETVSTLEGSGLVAEFDLDENLWPIIVDPSQFRNVIKHMVLNAREAMVSGSGGKLKITAANESLPEHHGKHPTLPPGSYVKISIQDHGCGISKENLPRIFDPYFSTKQLGSQKGMGLGLTLCDTIIRKHGGAITVESELGKSTTFHISLPASEREGESK